MQSLESIISAYIVSAAGSLFNAKIEPGSITFSATNPAFEGDITLVVFPYVKLAGKGPEQTGELIGEYLKQELPIIASYNVVKGFLNLVIKDEFWKSRFNAILEDNSFGTKKPEANSPFVMVEYSSPNTNKPLHLGHTRNILLGHSVSEILKAAGNKVMKVNLVNDRGIHICKSMVAWQLVGNNETPETNNIKGDHLVGKYYVAFDKLNKEANINFIQGYYAIIKPIVEVEETEGYWACFPYLHSFIEGNDISEGINKDENLKQNHRKWFDENIRYQTLNIQKAVPSHLVQETIKKALSFYDGMWKKHPMTLAIDMLIDWEAGDTEVKALWAKMNGWVYDGFAHTYKKLGVDFDKIYYESNTYILGKEIIEEGLKKNVFVKRPDGAVIIDLTAEKLDEKVLLRSDGTSVYMTQDLGTAVERHKEFPFDKHIYTVGNEQDYHFKVLKITLKKLGYEWADGLFHLSYGMVELPDGKMKSREGTVVDADELIADMENNARLLSEEKGLVEGMEEEEKQQLYHRVGMAALKYFILKVDPKKKMLFNPKESIDLQGNTGPFIQYTHARCRSIWRKSALTEIPTPDASVELQPKEKELIKILNGFSAAVENAAAEYSPALVANYTYELAKTFNQFYDVCPVLKEENSSVRNFRLALTHTVARTIKSAFLMLGIEVPERM
jgi:arginyl-tRNA synthetase